MIDINTLPIDVTNHVIKFRNFLNSSWTFLNDLMEDHDWDNDGTFMTNWIQANWEFLVERKLLGTKSFLFPIEWSNRITFPNSLPTHKIICNLIEHIELKDQISQKLNYQNEELYFHGFCTSYESSYGIYPPFDFINGRTYNKKKLYCIPLKFCRFSLNVISI